MMNEGRLIDNVFSDAGFLQFLVSVFFRGLVGISLGYDMK